MKNKTEQRWSWCLIVATFAVLAIVGLCQTVSADTGVNDAQPIAVSGEHSVLRSAVLSNNDVRCPGGNCSPPPQQPQVAAPPQFEFKDEGSAGSSGVPVGLAVGLPIGCAVIGVGIGVASQWRKTNPGLVRA